MTITAVACSALAAVPAAGYASDPAPRPVIEWNRFLLGLQATPGNQPATIHPTYELAIMHQAIDRAVRVAPAGAAADAAAHDTLVKLYPALKRSIDQQYAAMLGREP